MNKYFVRFKFSFKRNGINLDCYNETFDVLDVEDINDTEGLKRVLKSRLELKALDIHTIGYVVDILLINKL